MDKGYEKERFESLSIKASVVKKFRKFCKAISKSQSMTLLLMIEFFEHNGISPEESIGPNMQTLESLIKQCIHGVISIIKDMEKHQTKPTVAMLQALFENLPTTNSKEEKNRCRERKYAEKSFKDSNFEMEEIEEKMTYYRNKCARLEGELSDNKQRFEKILGKLKPIRSGFGKPYFKLEIRSEELDHIKNQLGLNG
ncbi:BfmA/BtgA family mobilization protein [Sinomicrobium pectinilyticum]|uniref:BfmA/BtgA family mobilization protein n=1 Tax=Sinomicrobium pectinilyticum TaxID=1084421 RepID=UPI0019D30805|nr:BfmA/BtgA family mobilization protein [Sinomicrobium pectinilyticum]